MTELSDHGITVELPAGFEGRAVRRSRELPLLSEQTDPGATGTQRASGFDDALTILHAATVPLPPTVGDFGSNVVDVLGADDVFVALFEYDASAANTPLFSEQGIPQSLAFESFSPGVLQRWIKGQSGTQRFFSVGDRAFCLYAVLGSDARRTKLKAKVDGLLESLRIEPASVTPPTPTPPGTVMDVLAGQSDLETFTALVTEHGLPSVLATPGPWTVFAVTEAAFAPADHDAWRADPVSATQALEHHIVNALVPARDLEDGRELVPRFGPPLVVGRVGQAITIDGITIIRPDIDADNGVVHVVDAPLASPS